MKEETIISTSHPSTAFHIVYYRRQPQFPTTTLDKSASSSYDHECEKHTLFDLMLEEKQQQPHQWYDDVKKKGIAYNDNFFSAGRREEELTSCNICLDMLPTPSLLSISKCKHTFCNYCIQNYIMQSFKAGDFGCRLLIKCPEAKCERMIMPTQLEQMIPEDVYKRWMMRRVSLDEYITRVISEEADYYYDDISVAPASCYWRRPPDWNDIDTYAIWSRLRWNPTFATLGGFTSRLSRNTNSLAYDTKSSKHKDDMTDD